MMIADRRSQIANSKTLVRNVWFVLAGVLLLAGCAKGATLDDIERQMTGHLGKVALGDFGGFTFEAPRQADWFVIVPAGATESSFTVSPAFREYAPQVPAELLKRAEPAMAVLKDGKVVEIRELIPAYSTQRVFAKPGKTSHGIRFVRMDGFKRNYMIQGID